jgi:hypothetical protein
LLPFRFKTRAAPASENGKEMTMPAIITPAQQFTGLSEAEIMAALNDPGNPIAVEVARLIEGYTENFRAHVR